MRLYPRHLHTALTLALALALALALTLTLTLTLTLGTYSSVISTSPSTGLADEWTGGQPGHPCLPCDIAGQGGNCTGGIALPLAKERFWCDGATIPADPHCARLHPLAPP